MKLVNEFEPYQLNKNDNNNNNIINDTIIIHQNEIVTTNTAYFYILYEGRCQYLINNIRMHIIKLRREGIEPTMNIHSTDLQSAALTARPSPYYSLFII